MTSIDPYAVPVLGHQGLLDALTQALAAAGAQASRLARRPDAPGAAEGLREALLRADAAVGLIRRSLEAGVTVEQKPLRPFACEDAERWAAYIAGDDLSDSERAVIAYMEAG